MKGPVGTSTRKNRYIKQKGTDKKKWLTKALTKTLLKQKKWTLTQVQKYFKM